MSSGAFQRVTYRKAKDAKWSDQGLCYMSYITVTNNFVLELDSESPNWTVWNAKGIWAFAVNIYPMAHFHKVLFQYKSLSYCSMLYVVGNH